MSIQELDSLLLLLSEKKQELEHEEAQSNMEILLDFLHRSQLRKQEKLHEVSGLFPFLTSLVFLPIMPVPEAVIA